MFNTGNNPFMALGFFALFIAVFIFALTRKNKTKADFFVFCALSCIILIALLIRSLLVDRYLFLACGLVWLFFAVQCSYIRNRRILAFICVLLTTFSFLTFSITLATERQEHKDFSRFYNYMSENLKADDMFLFPANQSEHLNGISAYLFPGHVHIYESSSNSVFGTLYWQMFNGVYVSYDAFNADDYNGRSAWVIVMDTDEDGNPTDFMPNSETELHGDFGWGFYTFNLYRIGSPGALHGILN